MAQVGSGLLLISNKHPIMKLITLIICLCVLQIDAQTTTIKSDTIPVWIVFLDSVRLFAAYPGVDMQTEVVAGWRIITIQKDGFDFLEYEEYYDIDGLKVELDMVLLSKRRKITPNRFRQ